MRVVFLNRYFHPDISATSQMLSDLALGLAPHFDVQVVTSRQRYDDPRASLPRTEQLDGVEIHRTWSSSFGRDRLVGRVVDYITFCASACWALAWIARRDDVVVALTDPPLVSVPAGWVARAKGAHLLNWLHDVFPEVAEALGVVRRRSLAAWLARRLRDRSLARAACNVAIGELMGERIRALGPSPDRVVVIHNWDPGGSISPLPRDQNPLRAEWKLGGRFVVGYSGNMGRAHSLDCLIEAAALLRSRADIAFVFIGGGNRRKEIERKAASLGLGNIHFKPYQPREALAWSLTLPDCHVVSLRPQLEGLIVPSKLYGCLAAGRPVIHIGAPDGEVGKLVRDARCGHCVREGDARGMADVIESLAGEPREAQEMGSRGRRLFEERFRREVALSDWRSVLASL